MARSVEQAIRDNTRQMSKVELIREVDALRAERDAARDNAVMWENAFAMENEARYALLARAEEAEARIAAALKVCDRNAPAHVIRRALSGEA